MGRARDRHPGSRHHSDLGLRLRALRLRYSLSLIEVGERAGLDISYISRLERPDALQRATPKPDTIDRVLNAIGATEQERAAVFHVEPPAPTPEEIRARVRQVAERFEDHPDPVQFGEERGFSWYYNRSARAAAGFTEDEYRRSMGEHLLLAIIDPSCPRYSRVPEEERAAIFASSAALFKTHFADQQFDRWYVDVVAGIYRFSWAVKIWESPNLTHDYLLLERQDIRVLNPTVGVLKFRAQLNHLASDERFTLVEYTPLDHTTSVYLKVLTARPEYSYSHNLEPPSEAGPEQGSGDQEPTPPLP
jgi:transcriptional regulator with XRE-family HTH domain